MRVPVSWLRTLCDPGGSTAAIAERLALTGTEVERIERVGVGTPEAFVIGKVVAADPHPDADRLRVCAVDDGSGEARTIVCGAPNVEAGQTVAVARPGALLLDGRRLGETKLRGVLSSGMILSEQELGVGEDGAGIMVLPGELTAGAPLVEYLSVADEVLELEVTPNRPDCLGVYGVARELHAATGAALAPLPGLADRDAGPPGAASVGAAEQHARITIEDPEVCLRFTARAFEHVRIAPSPAWLKARLVAAGQRPISNVVDITNYVMLLTGQPMHAFDLDEVRGGEIVVRRAQEGERMTTLDGVERSFDGEMALVCDAGGPTSIAGIMGGQVSEVSEQTTRVLMEAATWVGPNILRTSSRLGLRSEASTRFEKQLHPDQALEAQQVAARLMIELCGARQLPAGELDEYPAPRKPRVVALRLARVSALLGTEIPAEEVRAILERLGFGVGSQAAAQDDARLEVTVPGFRDADVQREADLMEEIARIHGLESLPATLPARRGAVGRLTPAQRLRRRLEDSLRDRGLAEIVGYSFTSPASIAALRLEEDDLLRIANPLSEEHSVMRPLLLPGLLDAARANAAQGRAGVAMFESARVYEGPASQSEGPASQSGGGPASPHDAGALRGWGTTESPAGARPARERHELGALVTEAAPATWRAGARGADFFAARALVEGVLDAAGIVWRAQAAERPYLHPGRAATIVAIDADGRELGWIGELHPLVARAWDLEAAAAFALDFDALAELAPDLARYRDATSFPAVLQDIAVVVDEQVSAAEVEDAVRVGGGELLRRVVVFDLYRGEQVGEGRKSLAMRLEFRAHGRTLTEEEIAGPRASIERELEAIGGALRA